MTRSDTLEAGEMLPCQEMIVGGLNGRFPLVSNVNYDGVWRQPLLGLRNE